MRPLPALIIQFGKYNLTKECIRSVRSQTVPTEVWLIDVPLPRPDQKAVKSLSDLCDRSFLLTENVGFARANNVAISEVVKEGFPYFVLLNNDTEMPANTLEKLLQCTERHPKAAQVAPMLVYGDGTLQGAGGEIKPGLFEPRMRGNQEDGGEYHGELEHEVAFNCAAALLVKTDAITCSGLIPDDYFMYSEDVDWSLRMHRDGGEIWYLPEISVTHFESAASGNLSPFKGYYVTRSNVILARRWCGSLEWRRFTRLFLYKLIRQSIKYVAHPRYVFGMWRGWRDGLRSSRALPIGEQLG